MNTLRTHALALAIGLAFSTGAIAESLTKAEHKAAKAQISLDYKAAKKACDSLSGNTEDICVAEAQGAEKIARANLEAQRKPSDKADYNVHIARADAAYAVANERCDDRAGNAKDVCIEEAKAARTTAKADATAKMKMSVSNAAAGEASSDARMKAAEQNAETRKEAKEDKVDARYDVEQEKCDSLAGDAKDRCIDAAKMRAGK
jgi:hypothetical protein